MTDGGWELEYYVEASGRVPVRVRNVQAREPLVRHLDGKLWELREESRTNIYRVIYAFVANRRIVLLHVFQKKTQRIPSKELEIAARRLADFESH